MNFNRKPKCPCCGLNLQMKYLKHSRPVLCPHCQRDLRISRVYTNFFGSLSLGLSFAIVYEFGIRGLSLLIGGFLGWLLVASSVIPVLIRLFPPELVPLDEKLAR
jgi:hypothetical protein